MENILMMPKNDTFKVLIESRLQIIKRILTGRVSCLSENAEGTLSKFQ